MKFLRFILWACVLAVMAVIFSLSAQPATQSNNLSTGVSKKIVDTLPMTRHKSEIEKQDIVKRWNRFVRKYAHFAMYFLLGAATMLALLFTCRNLASLWKLWLICLIACLLYAVSDEVHQHFVPGRGPGILDVLIDFSGASLSSFFICGIGTLVNRRNRQTAAKQ